MLAKAAARRHDADGGGADDLSPWPRGSTSRPAFDAPSATSRRRLLGASPLVLVVNPSFAAKSVRRADRHGQGQAGRDQLRFGGVGTTPHMAAELFLFNAGIRMTHVPIAARRRRSPTSLAGQLPLLFANVSVVTGQVKSGTLRALAVTSPKRAPGLPDVPTLAEAGVKGSDVEPGSASSRPRRRRGHRASGSTPKCARRSPPPTCSSASPSSAFR